MVFTKPSQTGQELECKANHELIQSIDSHSLNDVRMAFKNGARALAAAKTEHLSGSLLEYVMGKIKTEKDPTEQYVLKEIYKEIMFHLSLENPRALGFLIRDTHKCRDEL
jgi:6-pyruvoyl-tetrahydropterin synthase